MAAPRRLSRPGRLLAERTRRTDARDNAGCTDARGSFPTQQRDSSLIDPGRLIETTFLGTTPAENADAAILAWLALLPKEVDIPAAAADLARHLARQSPKPHSPLQSRVLDLLTYIAAYKRVRAPVPISNVQRKAKP